MLRRCTFFLVVFDKPTCQCLVFYSWGYWYQNQRPKDLVFGRSLSGVWPRLFQGRELSTISNFGTVPTRSAVQTLLTITEVGFLVHTCYVYYLQRMVPFSEIYFINFLPNYFIINATFMYTIGDSITMLMQFIDFFVEIMNAR